MTRDGRRIALESTITALRDDGGKQRGLLAVMRDITNRKRAEEVALANAEEFRAIFESNALGIALADARSGRFVRVNRKLCEMSGYAEDELLGMTFVEVTHPDDRSYADFQAALRGETDEWASTRRYIRKDGSIFWAEASGKVIRDAAGVPVRTMATVRDISERRRVDGELRVALEKYRVLFDAFPLGITISDQVGQIVESNQEAERLLGLPRQEHMQRRIEGPEWHIVRYDGTSMPEEEYPSVRALREGRPVRSVEMGIVQDDGATTWIDVTAAPIPLEGYGVAIVYGDVTARKHMADALRESEVRYQELYDTSFDGLVFTDLEGRYIGCNRAYLDLLGYETFEDLCGRSYKELTPPEYHAMEARIVQEQTLVRGYCDAYDKEYIRRSGERIDVNLRAWLRRDAQGKPSGMWAIVRDISERKQAETERERLLSENRRQREFLERLIEVAPVGIAVLRGPDHRYELVNPTYLAIPGVPHPSMLGRTVEEVFPAFAAQGILTLLDRVYETNDAVELREYEVSVGPGLERTYWNAMYLPLSDAYGHTDGILVVVSDVTAEVLARRRVEELVLAVEQQRSILQTVMEHTQVQLAYLDPQFNFVSVNSAYARGSGRPADQLVGRNHFELFPHAENRAIFERVRDTGAVITFRAKPFEYVERPEPGTTYWDWSLVPVKDEAGQVQGLVLSLLDVTDRERARETLQQHADDLEREVRRRTSQLQASEARLRAIFHNAAVGIAVADLNGTLVETNPALQKMLGYTATELVGVRFADFTHPDDVAPALALYRELMEGRRSSYQVEKRYIRKDGEIIWALIGTSLFYDRERQQQFAVGIAEDITERKLAQQALIQAEKLTITGRLAASLAHEINNPLQSVIGCLALAEESLTADDDTGELLHIAIEELDRAATIVTQLRNVNRPSTMVERRPLDVTVLLNHVVTLTRNQCQSQGVDLVWSPLESPLVALVAPDRIEQVFLNLILNAVEAMMDGGRLEITTRRTEDPDGVRISFADTGCGIPMELRGHLFEPFHTTKTEGLGLGLYVTHNIVAEHGGHIEVDSVHKEGTTFSVWLPQEPVVL